MENNFEYISEIVVDLSAWTQHYPTGCIMYYNGTEVDSQFCDDAEEYIEYIDSFKDKYHPYLTEVRFIIDGYDLDNSTALDCAKEVWQHTYNLIYRKEK